MRTVIQRVSEASVEVDGKVVGEISQGLLVLLGIENEDNSEDIQWLSNKISNLRIFDDASGVMNRSVLDVNGKVLVISQFTLHARTKKGNRPSYINAAGPDVAIPLYEAFCERMSSDLNAPVEKGIFGAHMKVSLVNDGPVTITMDTKNKE